MGKSAAGLYSVHVSTAQSWRGGENQIWLLAHGLMARGQRVLVVAPKDAPLLERCQSAGIPVRELRLRGDLDVLGALRLARLLRKEKPDILHLHDGHAVLPGQVAGRVFPRNHLKVVAHRRTVFKVRGKWKYTGRVDSIVAISAAVKAELLKAGVPDTAVEVIYSGLEFPEPLDAGNERAAEFRRKLEIPDDALLLAHAAALTKEKRQADLIDAVSQVNEILKDRRSPGVHLCIAGIGECGEALRAKAKAKKIAGNIHFVGFIRDLRPLWANSAIVVFASEAEGLCTALIEAQGAGLPAVVTRAGGMTEVVRHDRNGLVVDVGDTAGLAQAILRLYEDAALRQKMGRVAAQQARENFSAEKMVEAMQKLYRRLCGH